MAILITGGSGFVGSHLVSYLKNYGQEIILLKGDITRKETFENLGNGVNIESVIHLAAKVNSQDKKSLNSVNFKGTENVVAFCQLQKIKKLIFLSSIRVLSIFNDPYIHSKRKAESAIIKSGIPYIIIRPSMIYGPGDKKNIGIIISLAKKLPFMPVLNFRLQPIYVDDLVRAVANSLKSPVNQALNMVGQEIISYNDILKILKAQGYKFTSLNYPRFFSILLRTLSLLPFCPFSYHQVKTLLEDEIYQSDSWPELFNIQPTLFMDGLIIILTNSKQ
jgi:nucleoside-diphosphate-sugar epimerase